MIETIATAVIFGAFQLGYLVQLRRILSKPLPAVQRQTPDHLYTHTY